MSEYWKFLRLDEATGQIVSHHDKSPWTIGEWREADGEIEACENGFHCSPNPLDALKYVSGAVVARVEVAGACHDEGDKSAHQRMRIVCAWRWTADDSVQLAIVASEQAISIYEDAYPGDTRPRAAIEAAKAYLVTHDRAAGAAAHAAGAAAYAAAVAADEAPAAGAAGADTRQRIIAWMRAHIETLAVIG